jgi:hypothetical protein
VEISFSDRAAFEKNPSNLQLPAGLKKQKEVWEHGQWFVQPESYIFSGPFNNQCKPNEGCDVNTPANPTTQVPNFFPTTKRWGIDRPWLTLRIWTKLDDRLEATYGGLGLS